MQQTKRKVPRKCFSSNGRTFTHPPPPPLMARPLKKITFLRIPWEDSKIKKYFLADISANGGGGVHHPLSATKTGLSLINCSSYIGLYLNHEYKLRNCYLFLQINNNNFLLQINNNWVELCPENCIFFFTYKIGPKFPLFKGRVHVFLHGNIFFIPHLGE